MRLYGNMTSVEKQINKRDLEAYKNHEVSHYQALIPGLNNTLQVQQELPYRYDESVRKK